MTFSHWVRTRRLERNLSAQVLSLRTGIPRSTLSALERKSGALTPNLQMLMAIYPVLSNDEFDTRRAVAEIFIRSGGRIDHSSLDESAVADLLIGAVELALSSRDLSTAAVDNHVDVGG